MADKVEDIKDTQPETKPIGELTIEFTDKEILLKNPQNLPTTLLQHGADALQQEINRVASEMAFREGVIKVLLEVGVLKEEKDE